MLNDLRLHNKVDEFKYGKDNLVIHYTSIAALVSMLKDAAAKKEQGLNKKEKENKGLESEPM